MGAELVGHYLDPARRPPRVERWSERYSDDQTRLCERYVIPLVADVPCRDLTRLDFKRILNQATTPSAAKHLRACLSGIANSGLEEGYLLVRQDLLRGLRWHGIDASSDPTDVAITAEEIPTVAAVRSLAAAAGELTETWWRELELLLVAWSGMRWGEHVALSASQIDPSRRRIRVDRQVIEIRGHLKETLPNRRRRTTMCRKVWDPAARAVDWPRGGRGWAWTFHSLRHVFATWAIDHSPPIPLEDLSRLMGHSSTRVTQDIYVHMRTDIYDRFYEATG